MLENIEKEYQKKIEREYQQKIDRMDNIFSFMKKAPSNEVLAWLWREIPDYNSFIYMLNETFITTDDQQLFLDLLPLEFIQSILSTSGEIQEVLSDFFPIHQGIASRYLYLSDFTSDESNQYLKRIQFLNKLNSNHFILRIIADRSELHLFSKGLFTKQDAEAFINLWLKYNNPVHTLFQSRSKITHSCHRNKDTTIQDAASCEGTILFTLQLWKKSDCRHSCSGSFVTDAMTVKKARRKSYSVTMKKIQEPNRELTTPPPLSLIPS